MLRERLLQLPDVLRPERHRPPHAAARPRIREAHEPLSLCRLSSWTLDENRFAPARCFTVSSSTSSAGPHGVAAFAMPRKLTRKA